MKIAVITSSLPPHPTGGAERQALRTAKGLASRGHEVVVFARRLPRDYPRVTREDGVTWIRTGAVNLGGLRFLSHAANFLRDWRRRDGGPFEAVLAYQLIINGFLGSLVQGPRTPLVAWVRCESEARWLDRPLMRPVALRVLGQAKRVLFQAPIIRDHMVDKYAARRGARAAAALREKSDVLANAIALGPEPDAAPRTGLVFVGRLMPQKGIDVALDALRLLSDPPPLRILGSGPLEADLKRRARDLPVEFLGQVSPETVREELGRARALLFPSRWEGFPNAVLEAFERGTPALATRVGAVEDLVTDGENGLLSPSEDPAALAERIAEMTADEARWTALSRAARATAARYAWEPHLDRLEEILDEARGA